ncbi:MAG: cytochrome c [Spirochaetia bacterium]|nr:cytochrome c [Spirochaetia bacterium]
MKTIKPVILTTSLIITAGIFADDAAVFKKKCGACHTLKNVSSAKSGPDLTGVASRRPEEYVKLYMTNPAEAKKKFPDIFAKEIKGKFQFSMPAQKLNAEDTLAILNALK